MRGRTAGIIFALLCFVAVSRSQASYYEDWIVEGEVLGVLAPAETSKLLTAKPGIQVGKIFTGVKVRLTKCEYQEGHGRAKCREGQVVVMVVNHDEKTLKEKLEKNMVLRIRYSYSDSAVPEGEPAVSHIWTLLNVVKPESRK